MKAFRHSGFWPQPGEVQVIDTHISWVFLVGDRAYKVKKPVDFGFVDFSTLAKRHFFCDEELRLNRRMAPELYLDVRRITGSVEEPRFEGEGEPIEFAVEMRRFDQAELMANIEGAGKLQFHHVDRLAEAISVFHEKAPVAGPETPFGSSETIARAVRENFRPLLEGDLSGDREGLVRRLCAWSLEEHYRLQPVFERRRSAGRVRECHGDLHLGNIILRNGHLVLFDCIEFCEEWRWIDVMSDIAFCAMDLASRGREEMARQFLNACLERSGDYEGVEVLRYYLCYRAVVRAKVTWLHRQEKSGEERKKLDEVCGRYLALAARFTERTPPRLVVMHGLSGTGKSFGGHEIVGKLGAFRIRSDVERKRIGSVSGDEDLYSGAMTIKTYARLHAAARSCLRAGFSVVLDATYLRQEERKSALAVATEEGVACRFLDLRASEATLEKRVGQRQETGGDPSDADLRILRDQRLIDEPLTEKERELAIAVDTDQDGCWTKAIESLIRLDRHSS